MPPSNKKNTIIGVKGKPLPAQARQIIANVIKFLKTEAENGLMIPRQNFRRRALKATGISDITYRSVVMEAAKIDRGECSSFVTPRKRSRPKEQPLDLEKAKMIRELIYNFYVTEKRQPTINSLMVKIRAENLPFNGTSRSLYGFMKKIGFRWTSTKTNRKALVESSDIRYKRIRFLKKIVEYRQQNRPIIYTDETYIDTSYLPKKCWTDSTDFALKKPLDKNQRLIIVHAGGEMGFIPNCLLIFTAKLKTGDYHDEMNGTNFFKWIEEKLLPNMPPRSVLVVDNVAYHNVRTEQEPTSATLKKDMIEWLQQKNIPCSVDMTKPELNALIKMYKTQNPTYKLDQLLEKYGHNVLRLPPYHPDLNPIEKIWAIVKNWVSARNVTFKIKDLENLARQKLDSITEDDWIPVCNHVKKIEIEYMKEEGILDEIFDELQIPMDNDEEQDVNDEEQDVNDEEQNVNDEIMESEFGNDQSTEINNDCCV